MLLASGARVNDISRDLGVSPSTVSTYRLRILGKLKLKTNTDLVRYVIEKNLREGEASPHDPSGVMGDA